MNSLSIINYTDDYSNVVRDVFYNFTENEKFIIFLISPIYSLCHNVSGLNIIKSLSKSTISRSKWLTFFDNYINTASYWALIGDSLYILAWTLSFLFVSYYIKRFDIKIAIICTFLFFVSSYSETY